MKQALRFPGATQTRVPSLPFIQKTGESAKPVLPASAAGPSLPFPARPAPTTARHLQHAAPAGLSVSDALHLKSAEYWLRLGEPIEALAELDALPDSAGKLKSVLTLRLAALRAVRLSAAQ